MMCELLGLVMMMLNSFMGIWCRLKMVWMWVVFSIC